MCNGHSTRLSRGGTIAILKPIHTTERPKIKREPSFRLVEDSETGATMASLDEVDLNGLESEVIIQ